MFKINIEGIRANQYRLFHSKKFRGFNFIKMRNELKAKDDLAGMSELITEYLIEDNEMDYTAYVIYLSLAVSLIFLVGLFVFINLSFYISLITLISSFVCFLVGNKKKNDFMLGEMGIDMSEEYFKEKIREKFNL